MPEMESVPSPSELVQRVKESNYVHVIPDDSDEQCLENPIDYSRITESALADMRLRRDGVTFIPEKQCCLVCFMLACWLETTTLFFSHT
jgi:hypothetical protein